MNDQGADSGEQVIDTELVEPREAPDPQSLGLELPDDPREAIGILLSEVASARDVAGTYLEDLKRVAADFDNYRKRTTRESAAMLDRATENVVQGLMPVLDSFDAALQVPAESEGAEKLLAGVRSTHSQLMDVLAKEGLEPIPTWGEPFDPEVHEAVMSTGEGSSLTVGQELRRGYLLRGKLLRAALVALEASDR
jgi:molecular chaperone GrpE